jgi:hypothetical protein
LNIGTKSEAELSPARIFAVEGPGITPIGKSAEI